MASHIGIDVPELHKIDVKKQQEAIDAAKASVGGGFGPKHYADYVKSVNPEVSEGLRASEVGRSGPMDRATGGWFKFSPSGAAKGGLTGASLGSFVGMPFIGAGVGAGIGGLGAGGAALAAGGTGLWAGKKMLDATGISGKNHDEIDINGEAVDRNRVLPFLNNRTSGAIGGALLAMMIARQQGWGGAHGWILPVLGAIAGYNFLPGIMNKWKDPAGFGANSIGGGAAQLNQQYPLYSGAPAPMLQPVAQPAQERPPAYRLPMGY
jgi:hypothetical protein